MGWTASLSLSLSLSLFLSHFTALVSLVRTPSPSVPHFLLPSVFLYISLVSVFPYLSLSLRRLFVFTPRCLSSFLRPQLLCFVLSSLLSSPFLPHDAADTEPGPVMSHYPLLDCDVGKYTCCYICSTIGFTLKCKWTPCFSSDWLQNAFWAERFGKRGCYPHGNGSRRHCYTN